MRDGVFAAADGTDGVAVSWSRESADEGSLFDAGLREVLARAAVAPRASPHRDLWAYAGHDAGVLARHVPAAMLFVRNPTGISHHPDEHAAEDDCLAGVRGARERARRARRAALTFASPIREVVGSPGP